MRTLHGVLPWVLPSLIAFGAGNDERLSREATWQTIVEKLHGQVSAGERSPTRDVLKIRFAGPTFGDAELRTFARLAHLEKLEELDLSQTAVSVAGLKDLARFKL